MEFLKANFLNTTTQVTLSPNTGTSNRLFNRDPFVQFYTDGMADDSTTMSITIALAATTLVSRICLLDTNLKSFTLYYNGVTANTFAMSSTGQTTVSSFTSNSATSLYFKVNETAVSSVTLDMKATQVANKEKLLGLFYVGNIYYELAIGPSAKDYKPKRVNKQIVHKLVDGGTKIHRIKTKYKHDVKLQNISSSQAESLRSIWDLLVPFNFVPFGTATAWDGIFYEGVWEGDFDFDEYSDNAASSGFSGMIRVRETPI
jgi:hypothetical protein